MTIYICSTCYYEQDYVEGCQKKRCIAQELLRLRLPKDYNHHLSDGKDWLTKEEALKIFEENKKKRKLELGKNINNG